MDEDFKKVIEFIEALEVDEKDFALSVFVEGNKSLFLFLAKKHPYIFLQSVKRLEILFASRISKCFCDADYDEFLNIRKNLFGILKESCDGKK